MGFRAKLIFLAILVNLLLGALVWQLSSGAQTIKKQVQIFIPATRYLQEASAVHSAITRQTKEALNYLVSHKELDKEQFFKSSQEIKEHFSLWIEAISAQQALGVYLDDDTPLPDEIQALHQKWLTTTIQAMTLNGQDSQKKALKIFQESWETTIEQQLLPTLDESLSIGLAEVEQNYHDLLLSIGMIPWGTSRSSKLVEIIRTSVDYLVTSNQLNARVNTQFLALVDYLIHDKETSLDHYHNSQKASEEALKAWSLVIEKKALLANDPPDAAALQIADINATYKRFLRQATTAITLKSFGRNRVAIDKVVGASDLMITDFHISTSQAIQNGAAALVKRVSRLRLTGLTALLIVLGLGSIITLQMVKGMLSSLNTLNAGMQKIQAGDLDHRIVLKKDNIIGKLAQTFNSMMNSLCQTQTELENLAEELEQRVEKRTLELAAANKDLEAFNAMVTHDLRSPLSAISGYSQLIIMDFDELDRTERISTLVNIIEASEKISRIVSSLESLSHAGHEQPECEPVDLNAMATKILAQFSATEPQRKVETLITPGPAVIGDRNLIEIVLTNLLGNAWKYSSKTPGAKIEFGTKDQDGKQLWYIRDNGAGFDMEKSDRLFKPFGRLHSKDDFQGTGIGLTTVQRIIHRHGGKIWAEGKTNQGATFYFHFGQISNHSQIS